MGTVVTEKASAEGSVLKSVVGPQNGGAWRLLSLFYERQDAEDENEEERQTSEVGKNETIITISLLFDGQLYVIDKVKEVGEVSYVFPNSRIPCGVDFGEGSKVMFHAEGVSSGSQKLLANWQSLR
jgi:hypothetical protein